MVGAIAAAVAVCSGLGAAQPVVSAIVTTPEKRIQYLAHARIWHDPGALSPSEILDGPPHAFPERLERAAQGEGIECAFEKPGQLLGGNSQKFLCRDDGDDLRLKFWDLQRSAGNREVFAGAVATRLLWALGFESVPILVLDVQCRHCPENPMSGGGTRADRRYVGLLQLRPPKSVILSTHNHDQGWSWRELRDAIATLPPGEEGTRQRTHFDALTLLAVLLQHGDRKPEQQVIYCTTPPDPAAGEIAATGIGDSEKAVLVERGPGPACQAAAVAIVDVGATFGGAGHTSNPGTAKMNLREWAKKPVFKEDRSGECRGNLTVSFSAGREGLSDPVVSEEGRRFLVQQLHRLTPDHVRAIFRAAHIDELENHPPAPLDAWVSAFQGKVRQIESRRCQPIAAMDRP